MLDDLKKTLWATADKLRANMDAAEYKHLVLGLIFVKYISDTFEARRAELRPRLRDPADEYFYGDAAAEDIEAELKDRDYYRALRRNRMEARQQAGRSVVFRQLGALRAKADALNEGAPTLLLDASIEQPRYMRAVDTHCMPGSYHSEVVDRDIAAVTPQLLARTQVLETWIGGKKVWQKDVGPAQAGTSGERG